MFAYIHSFLFDLSSDGITKELMFMAGKLQVIDVFLISKETMFDVDTTSIILSYLYHFGNENKELFRYLLISSILNHASKTPHDKINQILF